MRLTRAALTVAATALTPALLLSAPAFAEGTSTTTAVATPATAATDTPVGDMSDDDLRVAVLRILGTAQQNNQKAVVRAATAALDDGSPEALRAFLETGYRQAQAEDDSVAVFRILGIAQQNNQKAVVRAATAALDDGSPEALRAFLETGYRTAQAEDDRVAISRILADPATSPALRAAAEKALDDGTPEALRYFLEHGRYEVDA
ncbi:ALF repeat-containing protein [Streptomyces sp. NEAU-sy36]|uniref:ALF repeat-containing protein n=1 Tax=unclassified Streptomyces TaxID=2593676 RepID=UPI0015D60F24|nr:MULTISPECIES: ALF repeat-containing protein [unclassified Streptomyces]QLJ03272.1 ALF repeat-containing protein [Streptomyces sp. NEAU-sy36]